jgi:hypothetical protein
MPVGREPDVTGNLTVGPARLDAGGAGTERNPFADQVYGGEVVTYDVTPSPWGGDPQETSAEGAAYSTLGESTPATPSGGK